MAGDLFESPFIFLSYAKEDKAKVYKAYRKLRRDNLRPWIDLRNLLPGHSFDTVIRQKIRSCRFFAVFLSKQSVNKRGYVQREIREALDVVDELPEGAVFIFPIRLENCAVPERLSKWQWVDLFLRGGYGKLKRQLVHHLGNDYVSPPITHALESLRVPRFDNSLDAVLYELFRSSGTFYWGALGPNRCVLSDGCLVMVRPSFPKAFYSLSSRVSKSAELSSTKIMTIVPERADYRNEGHVMSGYSREGLTGLHLKSADGQIVCAVDPKYWNVIELYLPNYIAYLTSPIEPVVVEESGNVVFVLQPLEPPQLSGSEPGREPDVNNEDEDEDHDEDRYDPIYADDRKFLEDLPFEHRV